MKGFRLWQFQAYLMRPIWAQSQTEVAGAEALKSGSEMTLFPFKSVFSAPTGSGIPPHRRAVLEQQGPMWALRAL